MELTHLPRSKHTLAFDSDCGPCTKLSQLVRRLDRYHKLDILPISLAEKQGLLDEVPQSLHYRSFHLILTDGQVKSGSDGVLQLIAILPMGSLSHRFVNNFPGGKRIVPFVYNRLSKSHDKGSCSIGDRAK